jgi:type IV secretory pathway TraG/TraD family ATPase VirD4
MVTTANLFWMAFWRNQTYFSKIFSENFHQLEETYNQTRANKFFDNAGFSVICNDSNSSTLCAQSKLFHRCILQINH